MDSEFISFDVPILDTGITDFSIPKYLAKASFMYNGTRYAVLGEGRTEQESLDDAARAAHRLSEFLGEANNA